MAGTVRPTAAGALPPQTLPGPGAASRTDAAHGVALTVRPAHRGDIAALVRIEDAAFAHDRISPRSFREFVERPSACLLVAERGGVVVGYALVLYRSGTAVARLYSIATDPASVGGGVGRRLMQAAEDDARTRGSLFLRLEVRPDNDVAIRFYRGIGFRTFGRYLDYYEDHSEALRLEKSLVAQHPPTGPEVSYYAQTTEFTCGPAAMAMAMSALDPTVMLGRALELTLWREATTIFMTSGHGGCEPVGMAVALKKRGFKTSVWVNQRPPFFLDGVRRAGKREVMTIVQETFAEEAGRLGVPIHDRPLAREDFVAAIDGGLCAIVLISPWRMYHERYPHWILVYGHDEHGVFAHDPWIEPKEHETAIAKAHIAIPWSEFDVMSAYGRSRLRAAVLVGKGDPS